MQSFIVIPARLESTRLPRKLLLRETGKPLIQHTYEAAARSKRARGVVVAADDIRIVDAVREFGGTAILTSKEHTTGTDRLAEAVGRIPVVDAIVNVQGDEPEISAEAIDLVIDRLARDHLAAAATLCCPITSKEQLFDNNCVKVVTDDRGRALYFSRSPIPYVRDGWSEDLLTVWPPLFKQHIGVYAYAREFLVNFGRMRPTALENAEKLEQLRIMEMGREIQVGFVESHPKGIDTRADYDAFVARHAERKG